MKSSLYHELTGQFIEEDPLPVEEDASIVQLKHSWLKHPETAKFIKEISDEVNDLLNDAVNQASTYHTHNNHLQIIEKLIRVNTLMKIKDKYSK